MLKIVLNYLLIALVGIGPMLVSVLAFTIGNWLGCNINEGGTDPCVRNGIAWGKWLNPMAVVGWLSVITLPLAVFAAVIYTISLVA